MPPVNRQEMAGNNSGKGWAVVTGASSGIGLAFARELARGGHKVLAVARRRDRLEALAMEAAKQGGTVEAQVADLGTAEGLKLVATRPGKIRANSSPPKRAGVLMSRQQEQILSPLDATLTENRGGGPVVFPWSYLITGTVPRLISFVCHSLVPSGAEGYENNGGVYLSGCKSPPCYTVPPMARERLGQHFLESIQWREEIARAIRVSPHSTAPLPRDDRHCWIEIGSGHGEMTEHLLSTGSSVYAIELDPSLVAGLRRLAKKFPNLTIVPGDILKSDLGAIASGRRIRLYGNLPYYITSPILHHLFTFANLIDEIHVVIQSEVAQRLAARPGTRDYGYLSVFTQFYARPEFVFEIPREAFRPPPEVSSALITLRLPGERAKLALTNEPRFLDFVKLCFSKKRKTLVNNLRAVAKPGRAREILASQNLSPDARAEQLTVSQFAVVQSLLLAGAESAR